MECRIQWLLLGVSIIVALCSATTTSAEEQQQANITLVKTSQTEEKEGEARKDVYQGGTNKKEGEEEEGGPLLTQREEGQNKERNTKETKHGEKETNDTNKKATKQTEKEGEVPNDKEEDKERDEGGEGDKEGHSKDEGRDGRQMYPHRSTTVTPRPWPTLIAAKKARPNFSQVRMGGPPGGHDRTKQYANLRDKYSFPSTSEHQTDPTSYYEKTKFKPDEGSQHQWNRYQSSNRPTQDEPNGEERPLKGRRPPLFATTEQGPLVHEKAPGLVTFSSVDQPYLHWPSSLPNKEQQTEKHSWSQTSTPKSYNSIYNSILTKRNLTTYQHLEPTANPKQPPSEWPSLRPPYWPNKNQEGQGSFSQRPQGQGTFLQGPQSQSSYLQGPQSQSSYLQGPQSPNSYLQGLQSQSLFNQGPQSQSSFLHGQQNIITRPTGEPLVTSVSVFTTRPQGLNLINSRKPTATPAFFSQPVSSANNYLSSISSSTLKGPSFERPQSGSQQHNPLKYPTYEWSSSNIQSLSSWNKPTATRPPKPHHSTTANKDDDDKWNQPSLWEIPLRPNFLQLQGPQSRPHNLENGQTLKGPSQFHSQARPPYRDQQLPPTPPPETHQHPPVQAQVLQQPMAYPQIQPQDDSQDNHSPTAIGTHQDQSTPHNPPPLITWEQTTERERDPHPSGNMQEQSAEVDQTSFKEPTQESTPKAPMQHPGFSTYKRPTIIRQTSRKPYPFHQYTANKGPTVMDVAAASMKPSPNSNSYSGYQSSSTVPGMPPNLQHAFSQKKPTTYELPSTRPTLSPYDSLSSAKRPGALQGYYSKPIGYKGSSQSSSQKPNLPPYYHMMPPSSTSSSTIYERPKPFSSSAVGTGSTAPVRLQSPFHKITGYHQKQPTASPPVMTTLEPIMLQTELIVDSALDTTTTKRPPQPPQWLTATTKLPQPPQWNSITTRQPLPSQWHTRRPIGSKLSGASSNSGLNPPNWLALTKLTTFVNNKPSTQQTMSETSPNPMPSVITQNSIDNNQHLPQAQQSASSSMQHGELEQLPNPMAQIGLQHLPQQTHKRPQMDSSLSNNGYPSLSRPQISHTLLKRPQIGQLQINRPTNDQSTSVRPLQEQSLLYNKIKWPTPKPVMSTSPAINLMTLFNETFSMETMGTSQAPAMDQMLQKPPQHPNQSAMQEQDQSQDSKQPGKNTLKPPSFIHSWSTSGHNINKEQEEASKVPQRITFPSSLGPKATRMPFRPAPLFAQPDKVVSMNPGKKKPTKKNPATEFWQLAMQDSVQHGMDQTTKPETNSISEETTSSPIPVDTSISDTISDVTGEKVPMPHVYSQQMQDLLLNGNAQALIDHLASITNNEQHKQQIQHLQQTLNNIQKNKTGMQLTEMAPDIPTPLWTQMEPNKQPKPVLMTKNKKTSKPSGLMPLRNPNKRNRTQTYSHEIPAQPNHLQQEQLQINQQTTDNPSSTSGMVEGNMGYGEAWPEPEAIPVLPNYIKNKTRPESWSPKPGGGWNPNEKKQQLLTITLGTKKPPGKKRPTIRPMNSNSHYIPNSESEEELDETHVYVNIWNINNGQMHLTGKKKVPIEIFGSMSLNNGDILQSEFVPPEVMQALEETNIQPPPSSGGEGEEEEDESNEIQIPLNQTQYNRPLKPVSGDNKGGSMKKPFAHLMKPHILGTKVTSSTSTVISGQQNLEDKFPAASSNVAGSMALQSTVLKAPAILGVSVLSSTSEQHSAAKPGLSKPPGVHYYTERPRPNYVGVTMSSGELLEATVNKLKGKLTTAKPISDTHPAFNRPMMLMRPQEAPAPIANNTGMTTGLRLPGLWGEQGGNGASAQHLLNLIANPKPESIVDMDDHRFDFTTVDLNDTSYVKLISVVANVNVPTEENPVIVGMPGGGGTVTIRSNISNDQFGNPKNKSFDDYDYDMSESSPLPILNISAVTQKLTQLQKPVNPSGGTTDYLQPLSSTNDPTTEATTKAPETPSTTAITNGPFSLATYYTPRPFLPPLSSLQQRPLPLPAGQANFPGQQVNGSSPPKPYMPPLAALLKPAFFSTSQQSASSGQQGTSIHIQTKPVKPGSNPLLWTALTLSLVPTFAFAIPFLGPMLNGARRTRITPPADPLRRQEIRNEIHRADLAVKQIEAEGKPEVHRFGNDLVLLTKDWMQKLHGVVSEGEEGGTTTEEGEESEEESDEPEENEEEEVIFGRPYQGPTAGYGDFSKRTHLYNRPYRGR